MPSIITITLEENGNTAIGDLPPGVFCSRFAAPPDATIKDVISINSPDTYTIQLGGAAGVSLTDPASSGPVTVGDPSQTSFGVEVDLPLGAQEYGTAACQVQIGGQSFTYTLGVVVNPANLSIPVAVDPAGNIGVQQAHMPVGVHFNPAQSRFAVWGAGGYTFAFSLPSGDTIFSGPGVIFNDRPDMIRHELSANKLTLWIYNNYLETNPDVVSASFEFILSGQVTIDPTIINNPINQGGVGGSGGVEDESRALVGAGADQRGDLAA